MAEGLGAGVGFVPAVRGGVGKIGDEALDLGVKVAELHVVELERVQELTVHVELVCPQAPLPTCTGAEPRKETTCSASSGQAPM